MINEALGVEFFADMFSARGYLAEHNNEEEEWFESVVKKVGGVYGEFYENEEIVDVTNEQQ